MCARVVPLLLLGLFGSKALIHVSHKEDALALAQFTCHIVQQHSAQVANIYRCVTCASAGHWEHLALEQALHQCISSQLPSLVRSIEAHETEPARHTDSINIFHLPADSAGLPLVQRILAMLNEQQPRKHLHKYIFVWPGASVEELHTLFTGCWQRQLLFGLAVVRTDVVYDFEPFAAGGLQVRELKRTGSRYFRDKLRNMNGHEVRFSMFQDTLRALPLANTTSAGFTQIDGVIARTIASSLNATARYVLPADEENYGRCLPGGKFSGVLVDIMGGHTHIAMNARFVLECIAPHVEQLYPYDRRTIYLVVPAAEMRPEYLIFVRAFRRSLWYLLLVTFLVVMGVFICLQYALERLPGVARFHHARWFEILEMCVKTQLGEPVVRFSRVSSLRLFLIAWIMFSYVLTTIYFAKLESSFIRPTFEPQLDALDELPSHKLRVYGIDNLFTAIKTTLAPRHYAALTRNYKELPLKLSSSPFAWNISRRHRRGIAFIMRDETAREFLASTYNAELDRPAFHIVKEYLRSMLSTYILPLGSPFHYKFQFLVSAFNEHGFLDYWQQLDVIRRERASSQADEFFEDLGDTDTDVSSSNDINEHKELRKKHVALSVDILQGAFYLWLFGILLSVCGFVAEHIVWFLSNCKRVVHII
ncbi:uncharacterized protein LOC115632589 [Scaptodrosophila lebanonensis]|uniref:Uncharacterized protein LOC115632589 n=1 Tax=Drosophila lebanonensis TaxID=7225 RepID=A0A6J2UBC9_DROLE|nr:uncharacterized protein LOC115632589 [Scaptodrosophila lebanonensis]